MTPLSAEPEPTEATPQAPSQPLWLWAVANALLVTLPLWMVDIPPLADLPQHMAQLREWQELLGWLPATRDLSLLQANPLQPNTLVYLPGLVLVRLLEPVVAGKVLVALLLAGQVAALHVLARRWRRPPELAVLASMLVLNSALYWCFANFLLAMPLAFLALAALDVPSWRIRKEALLLAGLGLLLGWAHVLVLGVTGLLLGLHTLARWPGWPRALGRALALVPAAAYGAAFTFAVQRDRAEAGFSLAPYWTASPLERLRLDWISSAFFGGLSGPAEPALTLLLLAWCGVGLWQLRRQRETWLAARPLLVAAVALLVWTLIAPDKYLNTIEFARRFGSYGLMLTLLALPTPHLAEAGLQLGQLVRRGLPLGLPALFVLATALGWLGWASVEANGLRPALTAIGGPARVLGLDFVQQTDALRVRVLLQQFAWAEALYGGEGNFSFAEHGSSVVRFIRPRPGKWTRGLEWQAGKVDPTDFAAFDYALVSGDASVHERFRGFSGGKPQTSHAVWRLYRLPSARAPAGSTP